MRTIPITAAMLMCATAAFAQSAAETTGVNSTLGIPPKTEDFVKEAAMSDMFEIESSKLALQRGNEATKAFAQQMIDAHQKTTAELKAMLDSGNVKGPASTALSDEQKESLDELSAMNGDDFNDAYQDDQEEAHEDAVDLFKRYAQEGDNAELKAWAAKTLPDLQHHLKMAQDLDDK